MKYLRYSGEFASREGKLWFVELWQDNNTAYTVGELEFDADEPLVIEWQHQDKENVICGSSAALRIISPGDRTYQDLYTIDPEAIRMDVYKDGDLYWSGLMDAEFYEEPYESYSGYTVELTFSDFGILKRKKYGITGLQTLRDIITYCALSTGINFDWINTDFVSSKLSGQDVIYSLCVRGDNFIDEEGEQSTLYDVVDGVLQPLGIKMMQREGVIYLFDLNGLYDSDSSQIEWNGDRQTMGVDKVVNNATITYSPYGNSELIKADIEYGGLYDVSHINITNDSPHDGDYGNYFSYYPDYNPAHKVNSSWDYNLVDFTLFTSYSGGGVLMNGGMYCHILPVTGGGSECDCLAYAFRTGGHGGIDTGWPQWKVNDGVLAIGGSALVLKTYSAFLPKLTTEDAKKYYIRVTEELLIDDRYNPFSGSTEYNDGSDYFTTCSKFVFIPAKITVYGSNGQALCHYKNRDTAISAKIGSLSHAKGEWAPGADNSFDCFLEYYNPSDVTECAIRGWKKNHHCIGRPDGSIEKISNGRIKAQLYDSFIKMPEGEYLPYPPEGGYLQVEILAGVNGYGFPDIYDIPTSGLTIHERTWDETREGSLVRDNIRWCLYKAPVVEVVNNNLVFDKADISDIEYDSSINDIAKEAIEINTICGTYSHSLPTARGAYFKTSDNLQVKTITRAGRTDNAENLLLGTLYSQYAERKTALKGEAVIYGGLHCYTEQNQGDKKFILLSEAQNLIADTTDAEYCEFKPDEYEQRL